MHFYIITNVFCRALNGCSNRCDTVKGLRREIVPLERIFGKLLVLHMQKKNAWLWFGSGPRPQLQGFFADLSGLERSF